MNEGSSNINVGVSVAATRFTPTVDVKKTQPDAEHVNPQTLFSLFLAKFMWKKI